MIARMAIWRQEDEAMSPVVMGRGAERSLFPPKSYGCAPQPPFH